LGNGKGIKFWWVIVLWKICFLHLSNIPSAEPFSE
jgi:hypothetical protein